MSPSSVASSPGSTRPKRSTRGSGRPAGTSGTRSTSCASAPNGCGPSAPTRLSASRCGTKTWWPRSAPTTNSPQSSVSSPSSPRPTSGARPHWRHRTTSPHPTPRTGSICAFDVVQRNAHEVCHHLWDVQRAMTRKVGALLSLRARARKERKKSDPISHTSIAQVHPCACRLTTHEQFSWLSLLRGSGLRHDRPTTDNGSFIDSGTTHPCCKTGSTVFPGG